MTTEEFLTERRLRAAELALESARRRVAEADGEIAALRRQVADLEGKVLATASRSGAEWAGLQGELEAERRLRQQAGQALWAERERARGLEAELRRRVERAAGPAAERRLAEAERRAHELNAELELVRRRAAEFEQQVRLAVGEAWRWLGETGERVSAGLAELDGLRAAQSQPVEPDPEDELLWRSQRPELFPRADPEDPTSGRFDEALSRLRARADEASDRSV